MQTKEFSSLGLSVPLLVPQSVEEYDANAKRVGACLSEAINNVVYRGCLADFRDLFLHGQDEVKDEQGKVIKPAVKGVEQITGIKRKVETKTLASKDEDGKAKTTEVWAESEAVYFKRVCSELKLADDQVTAKFQPLATEVAKLVKFDASETERKPSTPKGPPKKYLEYAEKAIAGGKAGALAKKLSKLLGRPVVLTNDAAKDKEILALAIKADMDAEAARREAALMEV